jgi:CRISPR-associated protein Csm5
MLDKPNGKQELATFSAKLASGNLKDLRKYILQHFDIEKIAYLVFDYNQEPTTEIKPLLRTGLGKPILAGSSIKGSIRTAILTYLIKNDNKNFASKEDNLGRKRGNKMFYSDSTLQKHYLGKDPNHDLLRMLQVGDFEVENSKTILHKTQTLNLYGNSWNIKQSVSNFLECAGKQTSLGKINIPETQLKNNQQKDILKHTDLLNFKKLFNIINEHTKELLKGELIFW